MLSWTENKTVHMAAVSAQGGSRDVCVQRVEQEQALAAAGEALKSGCVGLIVNTVKRAQMLREELRQAYPDAVILMDHSRFLAPDRLEHEQEILRRVGKNTDAQMRRGVLVIGTQVLEQSLDLDFDLLITDLCPMDLLLQRIGRLHRHTRIRPQGLEVPRCLVMGALGELDAGSKAVYGEYLLLRTLRLLPEHIRLPEDISPLVQRTYDAEHFPPEISEDVSAIYDKYQNEQKYQKSKAEVYLLASPDDDDASLVGMMDNIDQFTDLQPLRCWSCSGRKTECCCFPGCRRERVCARIPSRAPMRRAGSRHSVCGCRRISARGTVWMQCWKRLRIKHTSHCRCGCRRQCWKANCF